MSTAATPRRPADPRRPVRPSGAVEALMSFEAFTLAVFATLHLTGVLRIGTGNSDGAGVAEALICIALVGGLVARNPRAALSAVAFAIFGFLVGLSFTLGGGSPIDLAYHVVMLPILVATAALVALGPGRPSGPVHNSQNLT